MLILLWKRLSTNKIIACRRQLSVRYLSRLPLILKNLLGNATSSSFFFFCWWWKDNKAKSRWCCLYNWSILRFIYICLLEGYCLRAFTSSLTGAQQKEWIFFKKQANELFAFFFSIILSEHQRQFSLSLNSLALFFLNQWNKDMLKNDDTIPGATMFDGHLKHSRIIWHCSVDYDENANKLAPHFVISSNWQPLLAY